MKTPEQIITERRQKLLQRYNFALDAENGPLLQRTLRQLDKFPKVIPGKNAPRVDWNAYLERTKEVDSM